MIKITKSLKFRLTLIYSLILFLFASTFVFGINIYLNSYFKREAMPFENNINAPPRFNNQLWDFDQDQIKGIREIRLQDLRNIQTASVISLIPISVLSFIIGYVISDRFLFPLKILQNKIGSLKDNDLGSQVDIQTEDEIGQLANSFNEMSKRLKRSFDLQTQFVQDASHELRTPLTVIQTNLDSAIDDDRLSKKEIRLSIKNALSGMKRVNKLTEYLLDLTLPSYTKKEDEDLRRILEEQVDQFKEYARELGIKISLNTPSKKVIKKIDKTLFSRAIYNLLDNAIKYSKEVKNPKVDVTLEEKDGKAKITVKDNGIGIPKTSQDKIFKRFYRVDKSRSRKSGGFGLGLAISRKIVEDHGGKIGFRSNSKGSQFWIVL